MKCKWVDVCLLRSLESEEKISDKWRKKYCESEQNWKNCKRFQLEKKGIAHKSILPDGEKLNNIDDNEK